MRVKFGYEPGLDMVRRPYLWLELGGDAEPRRVTMRGLVDTGADATVLDAALIPILQIPTEDLEQVPTLVSSGSVRVFRPRVTRVRAALPGETGVVAWLRPMFLDRAEALWGRDFLAAYSLALDERSQQFSLYADDPSEPSETESE